jgi:hypothetical protein
MTSIVAASLINPNSGRELPALTRQAGLRDVKTESFSITTPHEFLARAMAGALSKAAEDGIIPRSEVDGWLAEQTTLQAHGDFFQMWFSVLVSGTV